jgi:hypothetical protein
MWMWEMTHRIMSMYLFQLKKHILDDWKTPDKDWIIDTIRKNMETTFTESKTNDYSDFVKFW